MFRLLSIALIAVTVLALLPHPAAAEEARYQSCIARWSDDELLIANSHFERKWRIKDGMLFAISFKDLATDTEWISRPAKRPAPCPVGVVPANKRGLSFKARSGRFHPVEAEALLIEASTEDTPRMSYQFQVFPDSRGVQMRFSGESTAASGGNAGPADSAAATGIETHPAGSKAPDLGDSLEDLMLAPRHLRFTQVTLKDQTDIHNELVFENEWLLAPNEAPLKLPGNLFFAEDPATGNGLLALKLAPLPHARPVKTDADMDFFPAERRMRLTGQGYPYVVLAYSGGRSGRIEALQTHQRQLRRYDSQRDGMFLSNTWGDRSRDARINRDFIMKEIEAGARLGVDVVQIDDGWQKGRSANSASTKGVWNGYWAADPEFWNPDPTRFPGDLEPVIRAARDKGMKFGLWFGPDTSEDGANWKKDADRILELHRQTGTDYFKLDSVKAVNRKTEANFHNFLDHVLRESSGKIVFDLDVTAEIRPGYFGAPNVGPIFVENRYTDWGRYWPHQTLRNLWKLSQYVDPLRLRMEFLNNTRNPKTYGNDSLAPAHYRPDTLFATVMFSNPLGWFETSNLPPEFVAQVAALTQVWKRERPAMFAGRITPIGHAPDGHAWTGFTSVSPDSQSGYVLAFRELNASADWSFDLASVGLKPGKITTLGGRGSAAIDGNLIKIQIPQTLDFLWLRLN